MTRKQGDGFIIISDQNGEVSSARKPPKRRLGDAMYVWTGTRWSVEPEEGVKFTTFDAAEEYTRINYSSLIANGGTSPNLAH